MWSRSKEKYVLSCQDCVGESSVGDPQTDPPDHMANNEGFYTAGKAEKHVTTTSD